MKKVISLFLAVVMLTGIMTVSTTASAGPINTPQTASVIGVGTVAQTFKLGYPAGKDGSYISQNSIYYKFTAPTTDYYEFSATGYESSVYQPGEQGYVSIRVEDAMGTSVASAYTNDKTYITKKAALLTAGQTYFVELYNSGIYDVLSFTSSDYGYAEQTIFLTIMLHNHEFATSVYNYSDGSYTTDYICYYCDYYTSIYTPAPSSNQGAIINSYDSNGYTSTTYYKPEKTKIAKLKAKKKALTVKWSKKSKVSGYQIQLATDKKFKANKKTVTVGKSSTTSKTISKLKAKKKYYVRVRTYIVVNGKKQYSGWSAVKTIKTK